jgi:ParB-like chromosome segregation protein Spo0J
VKIENRNLADIKPYPGNPRLNESAVDAVAASIREFGFRQPIVVDSEREGELLPRDEVRDALGRIAGMVRAAGDVLAREFGNEARNILVEALDDAQAEIERIFGDADAADQYASASPAG